MRPKLPLVESLRRSYHRKRAAALAGSLDALKKNEPKLLEGKRPSSAWESARRVGASALRGAGIGAVVLALPDLMPTEQYRVVTLGSSLGLLAGSAILAERRKLVEAFGVRAVGEARRHADEVLRLHDAEQRMQALKDKLASGELSAGARAILGEEETRDSLKVGLRPFGLWSRTATVGNFMGAGALLACLPSMLGDPWASNPRANVHDVLVSAASGAFFGGSIAFTRTLAEELSRVRKRDLTRAGYLAADAYAKKVLAGKTPEERRRRLDEARRLIGERIEYHRARAG